MEDAGMSVVRVGETRSSQKIAKALPAALIGFCFLNRAREADRVAFRCGRIRSGKPASIFLENVKIVLVEDKVDFCLMVAGFLRGHGAQVFTAEDGFGGVRLVRAISPDQIVTDVGMPGRSGLDLLMDIRNLGPDNGGNVPVLAISGYTLDSEAVAAGFQSILTKAAGTRAKGYSRSSRGVNTALKPIYEIRD
jgi:CheY-like chemotaxis protein